MCLKFCSKKLETIKVKKSKLIDDKGRYRDDMAKIHESKESTEVDDRKIRWMKQV